MKAMFKSAVHIILMNENRILLQKRKGSKLWPGYYALPAGHIDEGETQYDALVREAKEELDIEEKNDNDDILDLSGIFNTKDITDKIAMNKPPQKEGEDSASYNEFEEIDLYETLYGFKPYENSDKYGFMQGDKVLVPASTCGAMAVAR